MNPLTLLPLLAAVAMAAPGVLLAQPGLLNVPLTRTIHYQNTPVVTGYQQTILKPALSHAQLGLSGIAIARQIPELPPVADVPAIVPNNTTPAPGPPADVPGPPADVPGVPTVPGAPGAPGAPGGGGGENSTESGDQGGGGVVPPIPGVPGVLLNNANLVQLVNPIQLSAVAPQTLQVAAVRAAQAGDFEPLVTKEKVLAPVRTHTQITPQLTQIQPEISVRRIVHDVPVIQQYAAIPQNIQYVL